MATSPSERELSTTVFQIAQTLVSRGYVSRAENLSIRREGMGEVKPLASVGSPERVDVSQLERAAKEGRFWFEGPVSGLKVVLEEPLQGNLELGMEKMTFTTRLNSLNYKDFEAAAERMRQLSDELGLTVAFGKGAEMYEVILITSMDAPLSPVNVNDLLEKVLLLKQSTEGL